MVAALALGFAWVVQDRGILVEAPGSEAPARQEAKPPSDEGMTFECEVASVHDGDTLRCRDGTRIRLHAISARERDETCSPGHPCPAATAEAATVELGRLVLGRTLACQSTGRSYNRITAICWTDEGTEVNCAMVRSGTALVWERFNRQEPICISRSTKPWRDRSKDPIN